MSAQHDSIVLEDVRHVYGDVVALRQLSVRIPQGQVVGLLGPNGAGKSTLMKILTGVTPPSSGTAHVMGHSCTTQAMRVRQRIGYLPEHVTLHEQMLVADYLTFVARMRGVQRRDERIKEVTDTLGLTQVCWKPISALSKGYRQRVGLAQAILHQPRVVILDEPTTGLDPNQLVEIRRLIRRIGEQSTVLFSTHLMQEVAAVCDRVLVLCDGELVHDRDITPGEDPALAGELEALFYELTGSHQEQA